MLEGRTAGRQNGRKALRKLRDRFRARVNACGEATLSRRHRVLHGDLGA